MEPRKIETRVERVVRPIAEAIGLELVDVEIAAEPAGTVVRVLLDKAGGIDLETLTEATRAINPALDREAPIGGRYRLEVSSPGIERPLRSKAAFERFAGEKAHVRTWEKIDGRRNFTGIIEAVEGMDVVIQVEGTVFRIPLDKIAKASLVVEA